MIRHYYDYIENEITDNDQNYCKDDDDNDYADYDDDLRLSEMEGRSRSCTQSESGPVFLSPERGGPAGWDQILTLAIFWGMVLKCNFPYFESGFSVLSTRSSWLWS